jgi:hypothetical protein
MVGNLVDKKTDADFVGNLVACEQSVLEAKQSRNQVVEDLLANCSKLAGLS